ncbi:MAG: class I SAM-dependent methyltransferase [Zavarzinella sp.]
MQQPCLYCGSVETEPYLNDLQDRLNHVQGSWNWRRCSQCGSGVLDPFPKLEDIASFYPPVYTFGSGKSEQGSLRQLLSKLEYTCFFLPQYEGQARAILRQTGLLYRPDATMLDVGCGSGLRLKSYQNLGLKVTGMDFEQSAVDYVASTLKIPAVCTDIPGLRNSFRPNSFDLITAFQVIEHVPDIHEFLETIHLLLRPGGWAVITTPLIDGANAHMFGNRWVAATEIPRHLSLASQKGLTGALHRNSFLDINLQADTLWMNAGCFGLSAVPGAATTHFHSGGKLSAIAKRAAGAMAAFAGIPYCWVESRIWQKPSIGMVYGRKPLE